jgi:NADH dehydrogenase
MIKESQQDTYDALTGLGVVVKLNIQVDYVNDIAHLSNGETIQSKI